MDLYQYMIDIRSRVPWVIDPAIFDCNKVNKNFMQPLFSAAYLALSPAHACLLTKKIRAICQVHGPMPVDSIPVRLSRNVIFAAIKWCCRVKDIFPWIEQMQDRTNSKTVAMLDHDLAIAIAWHHDEHIARCTIFMDHLRETCAIEDITRMIAHHSKKTIARYLVMGFLVQMRGGSHGNANIAPCQLRGNDDVERSNSLIYNVSIQGLNGPAHRAYMRFLDSVIAQFPDTDKIYVMREMIKFAQHHNIAGTFICRVCGPYDQPHRGCTHASRDDDQPQRDRQDSEFSVNSLGEPLELSISYMCAQYCARNGVTWDREEIADRSAYFASINTIKRAQRAILNLWKMKSGFSHAFKPADLAMAIFRSCPAYVTSRQFWIDIEKFPLMSSVFGELIQLVRRSGTSARTSLMAMQQYYSSRDLIRRILPKSFNVAHTWDVIQ